MDDLASLRWVPWQHGKEKILKGGPLRALPEPVPRGAGARRVQPRPHISPRPGCTAEIQGRSLSPFLALLCLVLGFWEVCTVQGLLQQRMFSQTHPERVPPSTASRFPEPHSLHFNCMLTCLPPSLCPPQPTRSESALCLPRLLGSESTWSM